MYMYMYVHYRNTSIKLIVFLLYSNTLRLVGQGELEISLQVADYEQCMEETVIRPLNIILEVSFVILDLLSSRCGNISRYTCVCLSQVAIFCCIFQKQLVQLQSCVPKSLLTFTVTSKLH